MNITRLGHYYTPNDSSCHWAAVIKVVKDDPIRAVVNLRVIDGSGHERTETDVRQDDPLGLHGEPTFHLSGECPWRR